MQQKAPVWSVTEVVAHLSYCIAREQRLQGVWIEGELANVSQPASGKHCYFTLQDQVTRLPAVLFARYARAGSVPLRDGDRIQAYGQLAMYEKAGRVQFVVYSLRACGEGEVHTALKVLQQRLEAEGLFSRPRRALPLYPRCVGVVTSATGAAIQDIITVLGQRWPLASVLVFPALVQGEKAPASLVEGLSVVGDWPGVDVLIVGRGGGGMEDLAAFNTEEVVRAIAGSSCPVVAAVGHATDTTLSDAVADTHAVTPTAAATLVVPDRLVLQRRLQGEVHHLRQLVGRKQVQVEQRWQLLRSRSALFQPHAPALLAALPVVRRYQSLLRRWHLQTLSLVQQLENRLQARYHALVHSLELRLHQRWHRWLRAVMRLSTQGQRLGEASARRLAAAEAGLVAYSPYLPLQRGYAMVEKVAAEGAGRVQEGIAGLAPGTQLRIRWSAGQALVTVESVEQKNLLGEEDTVRGEEGDGNNL